MAELYHPAHRLFTLGQAVMAFESSECAVLAARRVTDRLFELTVAWAQSDSLAQVKVVLQPPQDPGTLLWIQVYQFDSRGKTFNIHEGCYLPEVIGGLCRTWATG